MAATRYIATMPESAFMTYRGQVSGVLSRDDFNVFKEVTYRIRAEGDVTLEADIFRLVERANVALGLPVPGVTASPPSSAPPPPPPPPRPGEQGPPPLAYTTGGGTTADGEFVYTKPVVQRTILEQPPSDYLARRSADVPNQWALVDRAVTRTAAGGASRPYGVLRADPAAFRRNAERAVYSTELPPATRRERGEPSLPAREPRTAMAEFGSPANVAYLLAACARHGLRADAAAVARFAPRARELLDSDSLALRGAARGAADLAAEVRRLNRAFLDSRAEFAALAGPPLESYAYAAFERDSLRPPGLEGLNAADLRGGFRSYDEDHELGPSDARDRYYSPKVRFASGPRVEGFPTRQTSGTGSRRLYERDVGDTLDVAGNSELGYKAYRDSL